MKPWTFKHEGRKYRARDVHDQFYGRAHVVFGWSYSQMVEAAQAASFRDTLTQIAREAAAQFDEVVRRVPAISRIG